MEEEFEKYLKDHQDRFETGDPPAQIWGKLEDGLIRHHQSKTRVIRIRRISYGVAAGVLVCVGIFFLFPKSKKTLDQPVLVQGSKPTLEVKRLSPGVSADSTIASNNNKKDTISNSIHIDREGLSTAETLKRSGQRNLLLNQRKTRQTLVYYSRMIGIRQQQIRLIQDMDPELYKKSQQGIEDLNKSYNHLKNHLRGSVNPQKILQLMIQNLQLQEQILNNQLQLIESLQSPNPRGT
jgi:hypothetical protein